MRFPGVEYLPMKVLKQPRQKNNKREREGLSMVLESCLKNEVKNLQHIFMSLSHGRSKYW